MEENEFKEKMQEKSKILGFDFSVEQISKFYKYMNMLIEWNTPNCWWNGMKKSI